MSDDITTSGGKAIVWHLREGHDNAKIDRDALALWIEDLLMQRNSLLAKNDALEAALLYFEEMFPPGLSFNQVLDAIKIDPGSMQAVRLKISNALAAINKEHK